ncbi:MAG: A24 family peptidase [Candidatus Berkiella sp.]
MLEMLSLSPILFLFFICLLGLIVGSFLNVVIVRLPIILQQDWFNQCKNFLSETHNITIPASTSEEKSFNLLVPRSHCPTCKHTVRAVDNIPILSYLFLGGKCRNCQTPISIRYPLIEILTAVLSIFTAYHFGLTIQLFPALLFTWALIALTMIDYDQQILPDNITLPFLWLGLLLNLQNLYCTLPEAILGASLGYITLWSLYWIFKLTTGKEGMGYGDFKLLAMLGAWIGIKGLLPIILFSSLIGAILGITLVLLKKHQKDVPIPFGPFLASAGWIVFLYGDKITNYYFAFSGISA